MVTQRKSEVSDQLFDGFIPNFGGIAVDYSRNVDVNSQYLTYEVFLLTLGTAELICKRCGKNILRAAHI